jgi:type I restriction enzyme, S subunit
MSDWRVTTLDHLVRLQRGYDLPTSVRNAGDVPVVGAAGPSGFHDTACAKGPGVVLGRAGASMGHATYCPHDFWPLNTSLYVTDFLGNDPQFVYYLLSQIDFSGYNSGAAQPMLNRNYIKQIPITIPAPEEQRRLSACLGALDDKIAVNSRIAEVALELAEALYLQASSSQDWSSIELASAASWHSGGTPKTNEPRFWGGEIPWISARSLKGCWIETSDRRLTDLGAASGTRLVPAGVVIFVVRGSSLKEEFRVGLTQREVAFGQDCKALVPIPGLDPHILFHGIRSSREQVLDLVDETSIGAGRLSTDLITKLTIRVPPKAASGIVREIHALDQLSAIRTRESRALSALRNTLLPELISGRLRAKDAEKVVKELV